MGASNVAIVMGICALICISVSSFSYFMFSLDPSNIVQVKVLNEDTGEYELKYQEQTNNWIIPMTAAGGLLLFFGPCSIVAWWIDTH